MGKYLIVTALAFLISTAARAQVKDRFEQKQNKDSTAMEQKSAEEIVEGAPPKDEENIWDRLVFGGNASASIGDYTLLYIAPAVGYKITPNLIGGTGFIYQYIKVNRIYDFSRGQYVEIEGLDDQIYGPKFFVNYMPVSFLYTGVQFEVLNHNFVSVNNTGDRFTENLWTPVLFLEAGFSQKIGRKGYMLAGLRLNLLHDVYSPYGTAITPVIGLFF